MLKFKFIKLLIAFTIIVAANSFDYEDLPSIQKGNIANGKKLIVLCIACHGLRSQNIKAPVNQMASVVAYGVNPPDLSNAGVIYNSKFLVDLMLNPNHAVHKRLFAMPPLVATIQDASDILAYLKSIAPKHIAPKKAFESACGRCHSLKYAKWTQIGFIPPTKPNFRTGKNIDLLKFKLDEAKYQDYLTRYLGKLPPDLSEIVYKYDDNFLEKFIADPKAVKKDTLMLRTGITKRTYYKIIDYLKKVSN